MANRTLDIRWIKRYKIFLIAGSFILFFQLFLAYMFIKINDANDKSSYEYLSGKGNINLDGVEIKNNLQLQNLSSINIIRLNNKHYLLEYEDISSNNNLISINNKNKLPPDKIKISNSLLENLDFVPICNINTKEAISSIQRAKTQQCKQLISNITCFISKNELYPDSLPHSCPSDFIEGKSLGCYEDDSSIRILNGYTVVLKNNNTPQNCISICLQNGYLYAGVQFGSECFCGNEQPSSSTRRPDSSCNMKCSGDPKEACGGYYKMNVYQTGLSKFQPQPEPVSLNSKLSNNPTVRIAFLLTLNGRSVRQVHRLVRALFHRDHFFLIHIDSRQDFLFRELLSLELKLPNVRLSRRRQSTIWGGASLLTVLLDSMQQLLDSGWEWDFIINLSESDYPVKTNKNLVEFLTANKDKNFVKSHGREVQRFISKQGLDKSFVECEAHMWRIGDRVLPKGIVMDGGSDWFVLSRPFVQYVASSDKDSLVKGLLTLFKHTLLPAESFFHTVLRNSVHCNTYIDNNLHITNWKRKLGCKCQYRHVVDWCGCSPNNFRDEDYLKLIATQSKQLYFARKFEPIINQEIINRLDEWLYGPYPTNLIGFNSYWENIYHYSDLSPSPNDALVTIATSLARINIRYNLKSCQLLHEKENNNNKLIFNNIIEQIFVYKYTDIYNGTILQYKVNIKNGEEESNSTKIISMQTLVKSRNVFRILKKDPIVKRLKLLQVSSSYDQKEQMSRDMFRAIGPYTDPVIIHEWMYDVTDDIREYNITYLCIDPTNIPVTFVTVNIDETVNIDYVKLNLKAPLLPGVWTIKLIANNVSILETEFLVTPIEFLNKAPLTQEQVSFIHGGSYPYKINNKNNEWNRYINDDKTSHHSFLERKAAFNSQRFGFDLRQWIDNLILRWYIIEDSCILDDGVSLQCGTKTLQSCSKTFWSSVSPDPKSEIVSINGSSGYLNRW